MKSIKNQYIALKEGKMTEAQFMRNVRMTLPEYISNVTLFKQAERILINKGIISEIKTNESAGGSLDFSSGKLPIKTPQEGEVYLKDLKAGDKFSIGTLDYIVIKTNKDEVEVTYADGTGNMRLRGNAIVKPNSSIDEIGMFNDPIGYKKSELKDEIFKKELQNDGTYTIYKNGEVVKTGIEGQGNANAYINDEKRKVNESEKSNKQKLIDAGYSESDAEDFADEFEQGGVKVPQKVKDILKEAKDGYYNQDGKEQYSKFDELDNMNAQEIMAGYVLEKIDNPDLDKKAIVKLVIKNLNKDQFYYTNYKLTGVTGLKPTEFTTTKRKSFFDQMEELDKKGSNLVDEKNKMTVVKEGLEIDEVYQKGDKVTFTNKNSGKIYKGTVVQDLGNGKFTFIAPQDGKTYNSDGLVGKWEISKEVVEIDESQKYKLKEIVRRMMKEMMTENINEVKIGDMLKHKLTGAEMEIIDINGNDITTKFTKLGDMEDKVKIGDKNKTNKLLINKTYDVMKEISDGRDNVTDVTGENI